MVKLCLSNINKKGQKKKLGLKCLLYKVDREQHLRYIVIDVFRNINY